MQYVVISTTYALDHFTYRLKLLNRILSQNRANNQTALLSLRMLAVPPGKAGSLSLISVSKNYYH